MVDRLSGESGPKLHLVALNAPPEIQESFSNLATECCGHFHSYSFQQNSPGTKESPPVTEDSDVYRVRKEITKAESILCDLKGLEHGALGDELLQILREVSMHVHLHTCWQLKAQGWPNAKKCQHCLLYSFCT